MKVLVVKDEYRSIIDRLEKQLLAEKSRVSILRADNQKLKELAQAKVEQEEEYISNKLLQNIKQLKAEKIQLLKEVEFEEEFLTNSMQNKLNNLQKEKVELEMQLEREHENVVNLNRKVSMSSIKSTGESPRYIDKNNNTIDQAILSMDSMSLPPPVSPGFNQRLHNNSSIDKKYFSTSDIISANTFVDSTRSFSNSNSSSPRLPPSPTYASGLAELLKAEIVSLRIRIEELERELSTSNNNAKKYKQRLEDFKKSYDIPYTDESIPTSPKEATSRPRRAMSNVSPNSARLIRKTSNEFSGH